MMKTSLDLFPDSFTNKQFNFSNSILINIYSIWDNAITYFVNKNFLNLDPLVCENSCHIRASVLFDLCTKYGNQNNLDKLFALRSSIYELIRRTFDSKFSGQDHNQSIYKILKSYNLYFEIKEDIFWDVKFLINCHVLTLTKKTLPLNGFVLNEKTCHEKILATGLAHNKVKNFVLSTQKELSAMSCQYIKKLADQQNFILSSAVIKVQKDKHGRSYVPQHPVGKVIISDIMQNNKNILFKVTRYFEGNFLDCVTIYFVPDARKKQFKIIYNIPRGEPCIVFSGVVNYTLIPETKEQYIERINKYSISLLINSNLAAHPQFSGSLSDATCPYEQAKEFFVNSNIISNAYIDYIESKNFAITHGCSLSNPTLLFLNHIYFDVTDNHLPINISQQKKKITEVQKDSL